LRTAGSPSCPIRPVFSVTYDVLEKNRPRVRRSPRLAAVHHDLIARPAQPESVASFGLRVGDPA